VSARARVNAVGVTVSRGAISQPPPTKPELAKRTRLIHSDAVVARAVELLNAPDKTLVSLAKAFEIVKGDLGQGDHKLGGKRAAAISGVDEQDLLDFIDNANYPSLSGDLSRHAGENNERQPRRRTRSMDRTEAERLVRCVILAWIDAKTSG
jgi:hypothetical protein